MLCYTVYLVILVKMSSFQLSLIYSLLQLVIVEFQSASVSTKCRLLLTAALVHLAVAAHYGTVAEVRLWRDELDYVGPPESK